MVDFYPLLEALRSIKGINDTIIKEFENDFRSNISSVDFKHLTTGSIPQNILQNCITSSLQHTAEYCLQLYEANNDLEMFKISHMIWNPLTSSLCKMIAIVPPRVMDKRPCPKKSSDTSSASGTRKADVRNVVAIDASVDVADIRRRLKGVVLTKPHLFETPAHKHVQCMKQNCEFCKHLFTHVNITRCDGHKNCTSIGWYPHVGTSMWNMVRKRHASGLSCAVKLKDCKVGEIPALAAVDLETSGPTEPQVVTDGNDDSSELSSIPATSPKRSYPTDLDWNEDMSEYYLRKRAALSGSPTHPK